MNEAVAAPDLSGRNSSKVSAKQQVNQVDDALLNIDDSNQSVTAQPFGTIPEFEVTHEKPPKSAPIVVTHIVDLPTPVPVEETKEEEPLIEQQHQTKNSTIPELSIEEDVGRLSSPLKN